MSVGEAVQSAPVEMGAFFYELWPDPLVVVVSGDQYIMAGVALALDHAAGRPCLMLAQVYGYAPIHQESFRRAVAFLESRRLPLSLAFMAPTEEQRAFLAASGFAAIHVHQNAFIDDRIFYPEVAEKRFAAVHNAAAATYKRHELAFGVPDVALITYAERGDPKLVETVAAGYRSLAYINRGWVSEDAVREVVCQARCGLILSAVEGANYASAEYLFCGIPVVSTRSVGGRDEFFDRRHVRYVAPDPLAVVAAVDAWRASPPDPVEVRSSVMAKALHHRARLLGWLSERVGRDLLPEADERLWHPRFISKLRQWRVLRRP